jgi:hypothetical protein
VILSYLYKSDPKFRGVFMLIVGLRSTAGRCLNAVGRAVCDTGKTFIDNVGGRLPSQDVAVARKSHETTKDFVNKTEKMLGIPPGEIFEKARIENKIIRAVHGFPAAPEITARRLEEAAKTLGKDVYQKRLPTQI